MIYNFRIDRTQRKELIRRMKEESVVSQDWGGGTEDLNLEASDFVEKCYKCYNLNSTRM